MEDKNKEIIKNLGEDRIGRYLKKYLKDFVFAEFSHEFLERTEMNRIMKDVPVPLRKEDVKEFAGGNGLKPIFLAENMAWVLGCDPNFKYWEKYISYLKLTFDENIQEGIFSIGNKAEEKGKLEKACIFYRASICIKPNDLNSLYAYARVCRKMYLDGEEKEYIGRFKAESMIFFELLTSCHPTFAPAYYYLGYAYLNMGLYSKAKAIWSSFIVFSEEDENKKEIEQRLLEMDDPIKIEQGCNNILATKYDIGIKQLEPFLETQFKEWWPLHYYLGIAYLRVGRLSDAKKSLKNVLTLNSAHVESMKELVSIYEEENDIKNKEKYLNKIQLVNEEMEEEN